MVFLGDFRHFYHYKKERLYIVAENCHLFVICNKEASFFLASIVKVVDFDPNLCYSIKYKKLRANMYPDDAKGRAEAGPFCCHYRPKLSVAESKAMVVVVLF